MDNTDKIFDELKVSLLKDAVKDMSYHFGSGYEVVFYDETIKKYGKEIDRVIFSLFVELFKRKEITIELIDIDESKGEEDLPEYMFDEFEDEELTDDCKMLIRPTKEKQGKHSFFMDIDLKNDG